MTIIINTTELYGTEVYSVYIIILILFFFFQLQLQDNPLIYLLLSKCKVFDGTSKDCNNLLPYGSEIAAELAS